MKPTIYYCPHCGSSNLTRVWLGSKTGDGAKCGVCHKLYIPKDDQPVENQLLDHFPNYNELGVFNDR